MRVTQEKLNRRHQVLLWIYEQGDARNSAELVWFLERVVGELQRLNHGTRGQKRLRQLIGTVMY